MPLYVAADNRTLNDFLFHNWIGESVVDTKWIYHKGAITNDRHKKRFTPPKLCVFVCMLVFVCVYVMKMNPDIHVCMRACVRACF